MQRLRDEAEKAKIELSTTNEVNINLPFLTANADGPMHFEQPLSRAKLESLVGDLIDKTAIPCEKALKDSGLKASDIDAVVFVGGMTRMPAVQEKVKRYLAKSQCKVSTQTKLWLSAAIQGGVLAGDVKDVLPLDVTPLSLGIETMGSVKAPSSLNEIPPFLLVKVKRLASCRQSVTGRNTCIVGRTKMAADNKSLGRFILDGIAPAPRGIPQIEVTFNIDANGILNVTAKDKGTGKEQSITIQNSGNLSKEDVEKAAKEAEANAEEDKKKREVVDAKNFLRMPYIKLKSF